MPRSNRANRRTYALWAPIYDRLITVAPIAAGRRQAHAALDLQAGERVLLVGVGTGIDLPLLPADVTATGIDLSPAMLGRARRRLPLADRDVTLLEGDAQQLPFPDATFDAALLALILSVVPDGGACLAETLRTLRPGGRAVVFDKFLPKGQSPSLARRGLNRLTNLFGTDINRRFEPMAQAAGCEIVSDQPAALGGAYRVIEVRKT